MGINPIICKPDSWFPGSAYGTSVEDSASRQSTDMIFTGQTGQKHCYISSSAVFFAFISQSVYYVYSAMKNIYKSTEIEIFKVLYPNNSAEIIQHLLRQINIIDNKGLGLMSLGGILLAITASLLPALNSLAYWARIFIVIGSSFVFASIFFNALFVFRLEWISQIETPKLDHNAIMDKALKIRARRTRAYHFSLAIMILGLLFYLLSVYVLAFS